MEYTGDPPSGAACTGCEFAHLPGMLCREQRTALTTARARSESKRDLGQVALRLRAHPAPAPAAVRPREGARSPFANYESNTPALHSTNSLFDSCYASTLPSSICNSRHLSENAAKLSSVDKFPPSSISSSTCRSSLVSKKSSSSRYLRNFCPKLSEVFVWLCLLGLIHSSCVRAAPTRVTSPPSPSARQNMDHQNGAALWINPCGMGASDDTMPQDLEIPYVSDKELLNQIVVQAKNALSEADNFKVDYVKKTFKVDYDEHHKSWKQNHYDWLPSKENIPKELGEEVPADHLKKIENNLDGTLLDSYEYLQRFAVGLEQVARDQRSAASPFKDLFTGAEYKLRAVLCEIQVAIIERNVERRPDITRDIMGDEFRNLDDSYRNLRDWLIYRDYMNALEYVIKVFDFFSSKLA